MPLIPWLDLGEPMREVLTGHEAELAVFGVRLPDEPLETGPTPFLNLLRAERERRADVPT